MIESILVTLIDTAGLRTTDDAVEMEGIRRGLQRIDAADVVVVVLDGSEPDHPEDRRLLESVRHRSPLIVISKIDLPVRRDAGELLGGDSLSFGLSTITGEGFAAFTTALAGRCRAARQAPIPTELPLNARHRDALHRVSRFLVSAADLVGEGDRSLDRAAIELRAALTAMGEITGETATEEVLDRIFASFCVGK